MLVKCWLSAITDLIIIIMEIILSKQCEALTGSLGSGFGYSIQRRRDHEGRYHFYSQRSKWNVPPDGHLKFIFTCADLAQMGLHISDIRVPRKELAQALAEAGYKQDSNNVLGDNDLPEILSANDIINFRRDYLPCIV